MNNTVTQVQIDKLFNEADKRINILWDKCTVFAIQLKNGFTIVEHSACVDPKNFDSRIGLEICEEKIKDKLWELEGYKLQDKLGKL
ncbi:hypothetical protein FDB25_12455 [Clostridium botulinum]|nr:hypothetical protein [Clostridium botulinum]